MHKIAKHIDIKNQSVVLPWVIDCVQRHYKRHDFRDMLIKHGMKKADYYRAKREHDKYAFVPYCKNIAEDMCERIKNKSLNLKPITIRERVDPSNGKLRPIGNESAEQQVLDYIAVYSSMDIFKRRIVLAQVSSIKGRGQHLGVKFIKSWVRKDNHAAKYAKEHNLRYSRKVVYFVKLDIRKCFPSARLEIFLEYFKRDCGNEDIIWLWEQLLLTHRVNGNEGFMIGALPSCWALQYMLSFTYRKAMDMHYTRRKVPVKVFSHSIFFMDDLLFSGANRSKMMSGIKQLIEYTKQSFGLIIKPTWCIYKLTPFEDIENAKKDSKRWHAMKLKRKSIDMMGYVIHGDGNNTIRGRIFIKARRVILRFNKRNRINLKQAQRACSYKGYFKNSCNHRMDDKYNIWHAFASAAKVVSKNEKARRQV